MKQVGFVALRQNKPASSGRWERLENGRYFTPLNAALLVAARQVPPYSVDAAATRSHLAIA